MLLAIALLICFLSIGGLFLELKSDRQRVFKSLRFWFGVFAFLATVWLFYLMDQKQRTADIANAVAAEKQAAEIQKIQSKSDVIMESDREDFDKQALGQQAQLEEAKNLAKLQEQQKKSLHNVIDSQALNIQLLNTLSLNRNLTGIQLSFTPSREHWARIEAVYSRTKSPHRDLPYVDATMMAERVGDHWQLDFAPVYIKPHMENTPKGPIRVGGYKKLEKLSTSDPNNKAFEDVIREALLGLRIEWGNGTNTALEPRQGDYPSAIYVSRDKIGLILRPPLVLWNLNEVQRNANVTFYGRDYPVSLPENFTVCSLDPGVILNQTIQLNWINRETEDSYDARMNRQRSGPHQLRVGFNFFGPAGQSQPQARPKTTC